MKSFDLLPRKGFGLGILISIMFVAFPAAAQVTTLLPLQDFNAGAIPAGWTSSNSSWYWWQWGAGGNNGSILCDDAGFFYQADPITAPSVDASGFANSSDSIWVDFDFFWDNNGFVPYGPDTWEVLAGSDILQSGDETTLGTYSDPNDYNADPTQALSGNWQHYHLLVPTGDRGGSLQITFEVVPGWGCSNPAIDNVEITAKQSEPLAITGQPSNVTVCAGQSATLSVSATGGNLSYQWWKSGTSITGATSASLTIGSTVADDAGSYSVVVSGAGPSVTSDGADLVVNTPPDIASQPSNLAVCTGQPASLSVSASGTNLSYQWQKDGSDIAGATGTSYSISAAQRADSGTYDVVVSGTCSPSVTSNSAVLTVYPPPTISVLLSPSLLWPPNHTMTTIDATVATTGRCTPLVVQLISVTSSEPGSGEIGTMAANGSSFHVVADRKGNGSGRVYTATYKVTDDAGNTATTTATVIVPHDHSGWKIADGGSESEPGVDSPLGLTVHPNPAANYAEICIPDLPEGIPVSVQVVNESGQVVATLYNATPDAELGLCLRFDCSNLPNGTYIARIANSNMGQAAKISVNH